MQEAKALAEALETNTHLTELYASGHDLENESIGLIGKAIAKNTTLRILCIGSSRLGNSGVKSLLKGLSGNKSLQQLDLEGKGISHPGAAAISQAITDGLPVESLLLARNPLGNEGMIPIYLSISRCQSREIPVIPLLCLTGIYWEINRIDVLTVWERGDRTCKENETVMHLPLIFSLVQWIKSMISDVRPTLTEKTGLWAVCMSSWTHKVLFCAFGPAS